jgi:tetratricopeptide (TPR) repeat protein
MVGESYQHAEELRKSGKYDEAGQHFQQLWQNKSSPAVGWRYAYCLRKQGDLDNAERVAREALEKFPEDTYVKSELAWVLVQKYLRTAEREQDLAATLEAAHQILGLNPDGPLLQYLVRSVVKVAKARENWPVVLEWLDRLSPDALSAEPEVVQGKRTMSPREIWYINRARALLEIGQYEEARQCSQRAAEQFPENIFLRRIAALALAGLGQLPGAISEMESLLSHPRAGWYMEAELGDLKFRNGDPRGAYRHVCRAMLNTRQSPAYKLPYFVSIARIALALEKPEVAVAHVLLARAVRTEQGWRIPQSLLDAEEAVKEHLTNSGQAWPNLPQDARSLEPLCRQFWQQGAMEGETFVRGKVKPYPPGRHFCYIQRDDGSGDVYALVQDLPQECRQPGSRVEFALKSSFDKKKQRPSVQATHIRRAPS